VLGERLFGGGVVEANHRVMRVDDVAVLVHEQQPAVAHHRARLVVQRVQHVALGEEPPLLRRQRAEVLHLAVGLGHLRLALQPRVEHQRPCK
jgi:hypothetical protein